MVAIVMIHVVAGGVGLLAGFVALYSAKGGPRHRRAGTVFAYAMLGLCAAGLVLVGLSGAAPAINVPAALLTAALTVSALVTVRPASLLTRWLNLATMLVALGVSVICFGFGFEAVAGGGFRKGMPAFPFFMFAVAGLLAGIGDIRLLHAGELRGPARIARHLWRMSFALFVAALSFFIGQADVFPARIRILPLLALPVLAVLLTMFYWLWRVRIRRSTRGITVAARSAPPALPASRTPTVQVLVSVDEVPT